MACPWTLLDGEGDCARERGATEKARTNDKTNVAASTPVSDGERVFAIFSSNDLVCLDLDGNLLWLRGITRDYPNASNSLGMASSPIVLDGLEQLFRLHPDIVVVGRCRNADDALRVVRAERPDVVVLDLLITSACYYAAYRLRFEDPEDFMKNFVTFTNSFPLVIGVQMVAFFTVGVYRGVWRHFGMSDALVITRGIFFGAVTSQIFILYVYRFFSYSRTVFAIYAVLVILFHKFVQPLTILSALALANMSDCMVAKASLTLSATLVMGTIALDLLSRLTRTTCSFSMSRGPISIRMQAPLNSQ